MDTWIKLAALYGANHPGELFFSPSARSQAADLQTAWNIIAALSEQDRERWISIGQSLKQATDRMGGYLKDEAAE